MAFLNGEQKSGTPPHTVKRIKIKSMALQLSYSYNGQSIQDCGINGREVIFSITVVAKWHYFVNKVYSTNPFFNCITAVKDDMSIAKKKSHISFLFNSVSS